MKRLPLSDDTGEVRELNAEDLQHMSSVQSLPVELLAVLPKKGRPPKSNPKKSTTIRLNAEVLDFFKLQGKGWQTNINTVLQKYVDIHR